MAKKRKTTDDPPTESQRKKTIAKDDLESDNLRNRLIKKFGDSCVRLKDGKLPSQLQKQQEMLIRAFRRIKGDEGAVKTRTRVVTARLDKILLDDDVVREGILRAVDRVSRTRVLASLLANFIFMKKHESDEALPVADQNFFTGCLSACRGSKGGAAFIHQFWKTLKDETKLKDVPDAVRGLSQIFVYQATEMETAASNLTDFYYDGKVKSIISWALRKAIIDSHPEARALDLKKTLAELTALCADLNLEETALEEKFASLGFSAATNAAKEIRREASTTTTTNEEKRAHLMRLQKIYCRDDRLYYDAVWRDAEEIDKKDRKTWVAERWIYKEAPSKDSPPLPFCHSGASFITLDKKAMGQLCPHLSNDLDGPWGYKSYMNPFDKKAKITTLTSAAASFGSSETSFFEAMTRQDVTTCPWLVAPTISTDGRQVKVHLVTADVDHVAPHGFDKLHKSGYMVDEKGERFDISSLLRTGNGVYRLEHVHGRREDLEGARVTGVDPGQVHVVDGAVATGEEWTREGVVSLMTTSESLIYAADAYGKVTMRDKTATWERSTRTDTPYGEAMEALARRKKRTTSSAIFVEYCKEWALREEVVWKELLKHLRRKKAFTRYSAIQRAVESVVELLCPGRDADTKRVVFFGAASFKACKGAASAPCKKIVRGLAQRCVVVMVPESGTTKRCPGCGKVAKATEGGYRTRTCTTNPAVCPLVAANLGVYNRDLGGKINIGLRGVYAVCGEHDIVPGFVRRQQ